MNIIKFLFLLILLGILPMTAGMKMKKHSFSRCFTIGLGLISGLALVVSALFDWRHGSPYLFVFFLLIGGGIEVAAAPSKLEGTFGIIAGFVVGLLATFFLALEIGLTQIRM